MTATTTLEQRVRAALRPIKDYPKPGILFQDITPVLGDAELLRDVIAAMAEPFATARGDARRGHRGPGIHPRRSGGDHA